MSPRTDRFIDWSSIQATFYPSCQSVYLGGLVLTKQQSVGMPIYS